MNGDLHQLQQLTSGVEEFCAHTPRPEGAAFQLNLVLEELFVNALRHGGCEGLENAVRIQLRALPDGIRVIFRDRGAPFDPTTAAPADLLSPLDQRPYGGLGIHFVREIMRDLHYRRDGTWNQLDMLLPAAETE